MARPSLSITDCYSQESPIATEFRRLLQNIRRNRGDREQKSILVTSAVTGEGKSTVSSLLSITAARRGHKTLLIDCDLRRPSIHRLFHMDRDLGVAEVLADGVPFKNVIKKTSLEHLDVVTAGKVVAHPSELFNTAAIDTLINDLKFYYDFTILDSPPVIPVSDPMLLSQFTDGVLMVIKAGDTAREVARRARDILIDNNAHMLGVVLNNASGSLPYYYDYTHYHYDYSSEPGSGGESGGSTRSERHENTSSLMDKSARGEDQRDKKRTSPR